MESSLQRVEFLVTCVLLAISLLLLPLLITRSVSPRGGTGQSSVALSTNLSDSPNRVTNVFAGVLTSLDGWSDAADGVATAVVRQPVSAVASAGRTVGNVCVSALSGAGHLAATTGRGAVADGAFVLRLPGKAVGGVIGLLSVEALVQPARRDSLPTISSNAEIITASFSNRSTKQPVAHHQGGTTAAPVGQWPIRGVITNEFGVNDLPYQRYHTGIDISDGAAAGITPVHPFLPGRVVAVIHSSVGLGNRVIIAHGHGLTSLYGHLESTSVHEGQHVSQTTTLGREGSTGASTGPHVHFEIRLDGQLVNPHRYVKR
jgi:murein DD-endopeptidase MepM/ murein hydrolase activator NlpD